MIVLLLVLVGLCLGSFVNAFVTRLHAGRDWVKERSECMHCHHPLAPKDLVPVLSWLWLRGKCRYCHKPFPDSPLVELAVPLVFMLSYLFWPQPLQGAGLFDFCLWLIFVVGFVALFVYDLRWLLLPNVVVFPLIGLAGVQLLGERLAFGVSWASLLGPVIGAVIISGLFGLLFVISRGRWIGFGDVKLGIVLGLLAGTAGKAVLLLFVASALGSLLALPLVLLGKAHRRSQLPFGPLLLIAMVVVQLWGAPVLQWYSNLLIG